MYIPFITIDHTECHSIIGSLWYVLHQLQGLLQVWSGLAYLLGCLVEVSQEELVFCDSLNWFYEVGANTLTMTELILNFLIVNVCA